MNLLRRTPASNAHRDVVHSAARPQEDDEDVREFQDFIESISLNDEELEAFIAMPGSSIPEVRQMFEGGDPTRRAGIPPARP